MVIGVEQICSRCISNTSIPCIKFDEKGMCNFCKIHDRLEEQFPLNELGQTKLEQLLDRIKADGRGKKYDCIVGVSGGIDSTYCLYMAKKLGLRPLAVHFDNGWNSDIAVNNMKNATRFLGVDLKTITCDWNEFKDLQIAFLEASVPDAEMPTDIGIISVLYRVAAEEGVRYILNGHSFRTEGIMPLKWSYGEGKYIRSVHKRFGSIALKSFPNLTISNLLYYSFFKKIRVVPLLAYIDYRKENAKKILEREVEWTDYGGHHFESTYTYFIIYLRWKKFGIDPRRIEYSAFIRSGQMTREQALEKIQEPFPENMEVIDYCIKRLGFTAEEFDRIMSSKPKTFLDYPTYYSIIKSLRLPIRLACKAGLLPDIFYEKYLGWGA